LLLEFTKESEYATFMEVRFPKIYNGRVWQAMCKAVQSTAFEYCVDLLLVLNAVIIGIQSYPELSGQDVSLDPHYSDGYIDTKWELVETVFTVVYVMEVFLKVMVIGWKRYSESARNMFDFSVTLLAVLATAYVYCTSHHSVWPTHLRHTQKHKRLLCFLSCFPHRLSSIPPPPDPNAYNDSRLIRFVVMARVLRLSRLLMAFEAFQLVGTISVDIVPAAQYVIMNLLFLMYTFASLGTALYGGSKLTPERHFLAALFLFITWF
jgi:Ion transport protein